MAKRSGLGQKFYLCRIGSGPAYDLSGDVGSIDTADVALATLDDTGIDKSAHERIVGLADGKLQYTAFWNNAVGAHHAVVSLLNGLPVRGIWCMSGAYGDGAFAISGILSNYPAARAAGGSLTAKPTIDSYSGDFPDWGYIGILGTDASGTQTHPGVDLGLFGSALTVSAISVANPTQITASVAHGLTTGDSVNITGSNSTPSIDGDYPVTVVDATHFTIPVNVTGSGTAGTVVKSSSRLGGVIVAVLQSIGSGTNYTIKAQHSADDGVADAYTDVGLVTSSLTAAAAEARVRSAGTTLVKRWVRLVGQGTYTNAAAVALFKRIQGAE